MLRRLTRFLLAFLFRFADTIVRSYVPVSKKGYWQIDMDDVDVAGTSVSSVKSAILDSGTSLLVGPTEDVKAIAAKVVRFPCF